MNGSDSLSALRAAVQRFNEEQEMRREGFYIAGNPAGASSEEGQRRAEWNFPMYDLVERKSEP